jgi:hypothetical protein
MTTFAHIPPVDRQRYPRNLGKNSVDPENLLHGDNISTTPSANPGLLLCRNEFKTSTSALF